ncbi:hypothetical protein ACTL6U_04120 [Rhodovibrionaceae bacterium A322]
MHAELTMTQPGPDATSNQARSRFTELLQITSRLITVLEGEIGLLRSMKPADMQDLQQDKIVLAAAYQAAMQDLKSNPSWVNQLPLTERNELREVSEKFQKVLSENERALRAARDVTDGLLKHVMNEVKNKNSNPTAYSAQGKMMASSYAGTAVPQPVSLNQSL